MEVIKSESIPGFNTGLTKEQREIKNAVDNHVKSEIISSIIHSDTIEFPKVNSALKTITKFNIKWD